MTSWVVRFDRRYAPVHSATMAWTRGPKPPGGTPTGNGARVDAPQAGQTNRCSLILRHHRLDGGQLRHLMPVRLGIVALQGVLTAGALRGLDGHHGIHLRNGYQRPALPLMARLSPTLPSTGTQRRGLRRVRRITRRRPRGVVRVLLQALQQLLDGGFERGNACFEGADILSDSKRRLLPQLRWERWCGVHGPSSYAAWTLASKSHVLRPRERLQYKHDDRILLDKRSSVRR